jgi:hypothetical protein
MVNGGGATSGKEYILTADITLSGTWTPIGTSARPFRGTFNGNGHTISGINPANAEHTGLFGFTRDAEIRDLCVEYNGTTDGTLAAKRYVGGIAGRADNNTQIINCLSKGNLTVTGTDTLLHIGGIAGSLEGSNISIKNSYGELNLTTDVNNDIFAGGIVGWVGGGARIEASTARGNMDIKGKQIMAGGVAGVIQGRDNNPAIMEDCVYETGEIKGTGSGSSPLYLGGIIGLIESYAGVSECYSRAQRIEAVVPGSGNLFFGGFAGYIFAAEVLDCGSSSPMIQTGQTTGATRIGGFAGQMSDNHNSSTRDILVKLERCWAAGDINVQGAGRSFVAGGLVGEFNDIGTAFKSIIKRCYTTGDVNVASAKTSTSRFHAGGLVGVASSVEISESWAGGDVNAQTTGYISSVYAGGLVGELNTGASIDNCYALGNVLVNRNATDGVETYYVIAGGLVGHADNIGSIRHSFTAGSVTAQSSYSYGNIYAGGVVGLKRSGTGGTLSHTAALGAKIVAATTAGRYAGRVYGQNRTGTVTANYALNSMLTGAGNYDEYIPGTIPGADIGETEVNGKDVGLGEVRTRLFWETTLGFDPDIWSFSYLVSRGYPLLAWQ